METMQPTLRNGRNVWDPINMPVCEFRERVTLLRKRMTEEGIDVLLAYGNAFNDYGNPCYLSNYVIRLPQGSLAVLTRNDITLFFEGASRGLPSVRKTTWVEDVRACPDISRECVKYLKEKSLIPGVVGLAGLEKLMPHYQLKVLEEAFHDCTVKDADPILKKMRMIKSPRECDQVRRASRIIKRIFEVIAHGTFPNMSERLLEAVIYREARLEGAEDVRVLIAKPQDAEWALRPADDTPIRSGDTVIIYIAAAYERYWSEGLRTFVAKETSFVEHGLGEIETLYGNVVGHLEVGKSIAQSYQEVMEEIKKSGIDYLSEYGLGEGLGLSLGEWPVIHQGAEGELKEGMCFTMRVAAKDKIRGGVIVGNTFCVSKTGVEPLTV
jgi:Xaa-Pro dipeptidase